jgi:hypothetical protein
LNIRFAIHYTTTEETLEEIESELQKEEEEAEQEYAQQDAELDAQGYVDGTPPLGTDDEIPTPMEMEMHQPEVEQGNKQVGEEEQVDPMEMEMHQPEVEQGNEQTGEEEKVEGETWDIDIEKDVEIWKDVEEWNEATEEHDKEWFEEYEKTHSIQPTASTPTGDSEPGTITVHRPTDAQETQGKVVDESSPSETTTTPSRDKTKNDHATRNPNKRTPSPVPSPFSPPTSSSGSWNKPTISPPSPSIADKTSSSQHSLGFYAGASLIPILLLFCLGRYVCRPKRPGDTRGEYRAVAARYGDMGYDNTFSDAMSDDEDDDFMDGHGDIEDDSWGKAGKRTLELPKFKKERNGGLSLKEMNG